MSKLRQFFEFTNEEEEARALQKDWPWFMAMGIGSAVVGLIALLAPFVHSEMETAALFGVFLLMVGTAQGILAFYMPRWSGFYLTLLFGVLYGVAGVMMVPLSDAKALTALISTLFVFGGVFRIVTCLLLQFRNWAWPLLNGFVMFFLGALIWSGIYESWYVNAVQVTGVLIALDLLFHGWSWVMLGFDVRTVEDA